MVRVMSDEKSGIVQTREVYGFKDPGNALIIIYVSIVLILLLFAGLESAHADPGKSEEMTLDDVRQGELLIPVGEEGKFTAAPLLSQNVKISISGMTARTVVKQHFLNKSDQWIEAMYVFPLPDESAVDHLRMKVGEKITIGEIKEKQQARAIYEQAKSEGRKTCLLSQQRPDIFTTSVANIGPGEDIEIEIEYQQAVLLSGNIFSLRFPMVVGPRYIPGQPMATENSKVSFSGGGWATGTDRVPDASQITPPVVAPGETPVNPVDLSVDLAGGFPLSRIESLYHGVDKKETEKGVYAIRFNGQVVADRDFVLEWEPVKNGSVSAALFSEDKGTDRYMMLMLLPPAQTEEVRSVPREMIFIIDTSGSMAGASLTQAKSALSMAISRLQPTDRFNVIEFNTTTRSLYDAPRLAESSAVAEAVHFVSGLIANGGTEIAPALRLALDGRNNHDHVRQVVFLTDGSVGNENELFALIRNCLGDSRLFTIGIGSAPNSYFMTRAASMGRGTYTFIGKIEEVKEKMTNLFRKLEHPIVSNLALTTTEKTNELSVYPDPLPDLYDGEPLIAMIKVEQKNAELHLTGIRSGKFQQIAINTVHFAKRSGIESLWARKKIRNEMESLHLGADKEQVRQKVLATALEHHLVSDYTSLVAMEEQVARPAGENLATTQMKTNMPAGWQYGKVFGGSAKPATPSELLMILGVIMLLVALILAKDRKEQ
jgi:Ca-activated chloride channel homolog